METNKLIGYTEIETSDGVISLKIGSYTLEKFCESYGIGLEDLGSIFTQKQVEIDGQPFLYDTPKDPIKCLALIIHHGVNYVAGIKGQTQYPLTQAYEWIDQIGLASQQSANILAAFMTSIKTGTPVEVNPDPKTRKKKASDVPEPA